MMKKLLRKVFFLKKNKLMFITYRINCLRQIHSICILNYIAFVYTYSLRIVYLFLILIARGISSKNCLSLKGISASIRALKPI